MRGRPPQPVIRIVVDVLLDQNQDPEEVTKTLQKDKTLADMIAVHLLDNGVKAEVDSRYVHWHQKGDSSCAEHLYGTHVLESELMFES